MPTRAYPVVLFDLDGTLIDSIPLILESTRHTFRAHGMTVPPDEEILAGVGRRLEAQMARFARDAAEAEAMAATYREHNLAVHDDWVRPFEGIGALLSGLSDRGATLGVVTSKRSDGARRGLAVTGLEGFFPVVVAADDVRRGKPDPEPIEKALADLAVPAARRSRGSAVYVGDTTHDLEAAHGARIDAIGVTWGVGDEPSLRGVGPTRVVDTPTALAAALG